VRRNPLECWTAAHFDEPIVKGVFPFARVAAVSDSAAVHEVLVEHPSEYPKSAGRPLLPNLPPVCPVDRRVFVAGIWPTQDFVVVGVMVATWAVAFYFMLRA
jgi:hypothetical protein